MLQSGIIKLLMMIVSIGIAIGIYLNPLTYGAGDMMKIGMLSEGLNEITKALGINYGINRNSMIDIIIFIEYAIFGVSLMITTKVLYKNTIKNIFFPLFIGLFSSVVMGYYGSLNRGIISGINSVAVMFCGLVIGIIIYLLIGIISPGNKFGKKTKYKRGR